MIKDQTFSKTNRLLKPSEFQSVYTKRQWVANRELVANFRQNNSQNAKLGLTVSKKISKRAVDRNRIKRQVREWFRQNKQVFGCIDLIITAKPALKSKTTIEIQQSLDDLWRKVQKKC